MGGKRILLQRVGSGMRRENVNRTAGISLLDNTTTHGHTHTRTKKKMSGLDAKFDAVKGAHV